MTTTAGPIASAVTSPRQSLALAVGLGSVLAMAILLLPPGAAGVVALVGWFAVVALVDIRATVLCLIVARSSLDVAADINLVSAGPLGDLNVAAVLTGVLVATGLAYIAVNRVNVSKTPLVWPFSALLAVFLVGILYAPDPGGALEDWFRSVGVFMLYILLVDMLRDEKRIAHLVTALLLSAVVPVVVGAYQIATGAGDQYTDGFTRVEATFTHPTPYAIFLVTLLPVVIVAFVRARSDMAKLALSVLAVAMIVCVIATFTRGAWVGLLVVLLVMGAVKYRFALLVVPAAALLIWIAVPSVQQRLANVDANDSSIAWRFQQWQDALAIQSSWQHLTGAGLEAVGSRLGNSTHNDYVRIWVEAGVLGSVAFLWLYGSLVKMTIAAYRAATSDYHRNLILAFAAILAARLVMFAWDNLLVHPVLEWYFWSLAALTVALGAQGSAAGKQPTGQLLAKGVGR
jgi:putative inorganic carbon (HCO3(-)) transporter